MTTYPNKPKELRNFVMRILGSKLAMCVNQINYVKSYYWWEGKITHGQEKILLIKTSDENAGKLKIFLEKNHPYDVSEIVELSPESVNEGYLGWIGK
ncbi:MAG: divalent-cation tolerance protein CutA [Candidatus Gracilibacteria bacterium]|nr:divalent-cation tolerance protein CutA [Candidatus Gracilibacteria bacterium]